MSDTVIRVENLGKKYIIGHRKQEPYTALRDVIADGSKSFGRNLLKSFGKKIIDPGCEEFWALKDVSFEIKQGEVVGIIGRNGAGKSTLLKILSRITEPTNGRICIKGRVASLLEVGTGFHPELTGRENIYLNGAILGMSKQEIKNNFDDIVEFAEVDKFIDNPVKRYSSGMYVRLAFAVAAHLDPEILIVDEVLAVGDVAFQKKCLGKMRNVAKKEGRTVLFVSHNMSAVSTLCQKGLLLQNGKLISDSCIEEVIRIYANDPNSSNITEWKGQAGDENINLLRSWVSSHDKDGYFHTAANVEIGIEFEVIKKIEGFILGFNLLSEFEYPLAYVLHEEIQKGSVITLEAGRFVKKFLIPANTLAQGTYRIQFDIGIHMRKRIIHEEGQLSFTVDNISNVGNYIPPYQRGFVSLFQPKWALLD